MILLLHKTKEGKLTKVAENEIGLKPFNEYDFRSSIELPFENPSKGLVFGVIFSIPFWLLFIGILILF